MKNLFLKIYSRLAMFTTSVNLLRMLSKQTAKALILSVIFILVASFFTTGQKNNKIVEKPIAKPVIDSAEHREILKQYIYNQSGVKVPDGVPYETIKFMHDQCNNKDIPHIIFFRLVYAESGFDSTVTSYAGATGYCGIMPETFEIWSKRLNLKGKSNRNNVIISTELLRYLNDRFKHLGERRGWELTLASYNAGIGRVVAANYNVPEIKETQNYIRIILKGYKNE